MYGPNDKLNTTGCEEKDGRFSVGNEAKGWTGDSGKEKWIAWRSSGVDELEVPVGNMGQAIDGSESCFSRSAPTLNGPGFEI